MTIDLLRSFRNAQPFRPFFLFLSDGRKLRVSHPEKIGWSPNGRSLGIYTRGDAGAILDVDQVIKIQAAAQRGAKRGSK